MSGKYLHCKADGTACLSNASAELNGDVAVLPYETGMKVVVRVSLSSGTKRCAAVTVGEMQDGECRAIANMEKAGEGARVVSCELKPVTKQKAVPKEVPVDEVLPDVEPDEDGGTPAALWVSGMKNVPSALPSGRIAFLIMQAEWYEMIESGEKNVESRKQCKKYKSMFIDHHPVAVRLQYGFTPRQMIWQIAGVEDYGDDGIDILLGKRIQ